MPDVNYAQNVTTTHNLLEAVRKAKIGKTETLGFPFSSTVSGEPNWGSKGLKQFVHHVCIGGFVLRVQLEHGV